MIISTPIPSSKTARISHVVFVRFMFHPPQGNIKRLQFPAFDRV
jgi:hypothetical protein